jgi:hypothetical protein
MEITILPQSPVSRPFFAVVPSKTWVPRRSTEQENTDFFRSSGHEGSDRMVSNQRWFALKPD